MTPFIRLHPADDVLITRAQLLGGAVVEGITVRGIIPPGHKIATHAIGAGEPVRRYNQIIGFASRAIAPGEHIHTHNLDMGPDKGDFARDYAFGADVKPAVAPLEASFMGFKRSDGRVATRNYIGILSSVNCSATAARAIADHFSRTGNPARLATCGNGTPTPAAVAAALPPAGARFPARGRLGGGPARFVAHDQWSSRFAISTATRAASRPLSAARASAWASFSQVSTALAIGTLWSSPTRVTAAPLSLATSSK